MQKYQCQVYSLKFLKGEILNTKCKLFGSEPAQFATLQINVMN